MNRLNMVHTAVAIKSQHKTAAQGPNLPPDGDTSEKFQFIGCKLLTHIALLLLWVWLTACKDEAKSEIPLIVAEVSPQAGYIGDTVRLTGSNFGTNSANVVVAFNNLAGKIVSITDNELKVIIPPFATEGVLTAGRPGGQTIDALPLFTVLKEGAPIIDEITPIEVTNGDVVTLKGSNFSIFPYRNLVSIEGATAIVLNATETELQIIVPGAAVSGKIAVNIKGLQSNSKDLGVKNFNPVAEGRIYYVSGYRGGGASTGTLREGIAYVVKGAETSFIVPSGDIVYTDPSDGLIGVNSKDGLIHNFFYGYSFESYPQANTLVYGSQTTKFSTTVFSFIKINTDNGAREVIYSTDNSNHQNFKPTSSVFLLDRKTGDIYYIGQNTSSQSQYYLFKGHVDGRAPIALNSTPYDVGTEPFLLALSKERIFFAPGPRSTDLQSMDKQAGDIQNHAGNTEALELGLLGMDARQTDNKLYYRGTTGSLIFLYEFDFDTGANRILYPFSFLLKGKNEDLFSYQKFRQLIAIKVTETNVYFVRNDVQVFRVKIDGSTVNEPSLVYVDTRVKPLNYTTLNLAIDTDD
jgi:hypothetical protein